MLVGSVDRVFVLDLGATTCIVVPCTLQRAVSLLRVLESPQISADGVLSHLLSFRISFYPHVGKVRTGRT